MNSIGSFYQEILSTSPKFGLLPRGREAVGPAPYLLPVVSEVPSHRTMRSKDVMALGWPCSKTQKQVMDSGINWMERTNYETE
ncbi:jg11065 [Pararge aegeria aegeria]|uniref:Jg11065 protein n=1 Tax=Pararge aegeria aegeria TaxID=348720 RepID=A0A8S4R9E9_9NEOP|nr:jg11065 [Pararge aegeria aegeria]